MYTRMRTDIMMCVTTMNKLSHRDECVYFLELKCHLLNITLCTCTVDKGNSMIGIIHSTNPEFSLFAVKCILLESVAERPEIVLIAGGPPLHYLLSQNTRVQHTHSGCHLLICRGCRHVILLFIWSIKRGVLAACGRLKNNTLEFSQSSRAACYIVYLVAAYFLIQILWSVKR
jgi:hypothetical protein